MKKYFFTLSIVAIFATVACDTSSKGTTTQMAAAPQTQPAPSAPNAFKADSAVSAQQMKKGYSAKAKTMEMAAPKPEVMRAASEGTPIKQ
jgi:hypothetical protein